MVERSALFASLRLCVEKFDRHSGRELDRMAQAVAIAAEAFQASVDAAHFGVPPR
jgi:hypothetical protein